MAQPALDKTGAELLAKWLVESMDQPACCLSPQGSIQCCNRAFGDALRAYPTQLQGSPMILLISSAMRAAFERIFRNSLVEKSQGELDLEPVSGTLLPIHVTCAPLPFGAGSVLLTFADRSERKRNQQLLDTIKERDEFITSLEHELRNPLAPLRNAIEILKIKGVPDPDMQWALGVIDRQVGVMNRMLDKLLNLSRLRSGKVQLQKTRLDATLIMAKAIKSVQPLMDERKHQLTVALPPKPIWLQADPLFLEQIMANLLSSAAKNTADEGQIWFVAEEHGGELRIKVRDSGNGIAPEALDRVFEPYVPAANSRESKTADLEIGLTTARSLVELHGGRIQALSDGLGKGTEFVVHLPL